MYRILVPVTEVINIRRTNDGVKGDVSRTGDSCASELWVFLPCTIASIAVCRDSASCKSSVMRLRLAGALYFTWNSAICPAASGFSVVHTERRP